MLNPMLNPNPLYTRTHCTYLDRHVNSEFNLSCAINNYNYSNYCVFSSLLFIPGPKHGFWPLLLASPSSEGQMKPEASLQHTEIAFTVTPSSSSPSSRYYLNKQ